MRRILFVFFFLLFLGSLIVTAYLLYQRQQEERNSSFDGLTITTTFYPVAEVARQVGGPYVRVITMVPPGAEAHIYEPTPQEIARIRASQGFLYLGELHPWAVKILPDLEKAGVQTLDMSSSLGDVDDNGDRDPHIWLDPVLVQKQVGLVRDFFVKIDASHAASYRANADRYLDLLQKLDNQYRSELAQCEIREVIVAHDAFSYLASRYDLKFLSIVGLSPEEEPSAKRLAALAKLAREHNIRFFYFESPASKKLSETLASEVGAETLVLNPLETLSSEDVASGKDYISVMKENLHNLKRAYVCKNS